MGPKSTRIALAVALAVLGGPALLPSLGNGLASAHATKPLPRVTITGKVLLGDVKSFRAVGVVDRKVVFDSIPAIKTLRSERVPRDSARYHFLVYEANRSFQRAVQRASITSKVDLIVEAGGVSAAGIEVRELTELTKSYVGKTP